MNYKDISYSESNPICTVDYNQQSIDILKNTEGKTIYVGNKSSDKSSCVGNYSKQTLTITSDTDGCSGSVSQNDETAGKISIVVSKNEEKQDRIIIYKINNIALIYIKQSANATDAINYYINISTSTAAGVAEVKFEQPSEAGATASVSISNLAWGQYAEGLDISNIEIVDASHAVDYRDISNYVILVDLNDNYTYTFSYLTFDLFGNEGKDGTGDMSTFKFYGYNVSKNTGSFSINEDITFQSGHTYELQWKDSSNIPNIFNLDPTDCSDNYIFKGFNWIGPCLQYKCIKEKTFQIDCLDDQKQTLTQVENVTDTGFTFYYRIQISESSGLEDTERKAIINYINNNMTKNISGQQFIKIKNRSNEPIYYNYPNATISPTKQDDFTIITDSIRVEYNKFYNITSSSFEKYRLYINLEPILTIINNCCLAKPEGFTINGWTYRLNNTEEPFTYHAVYEYGNGNNVIYIGTVGQDVD